MEFTYVDAKGMKSLEDYAVSLVTGILSLKTLESFQARVMDLGILKEDQGCRTNTILWDLKRMMKLYQDQLESVLELLPDDFDTKTIIDSLKAHELTRARSMTKKKKG
jgi:phage-related minor tail protein